MTSYKSFRLPYVTIKMRESKLFWLGVTMFTIPAFVLLATKQTLLFTPVGTDLTISIPYVIMGIGITIWFYDLAVRGRKRKSS